MTTDYDTPKLVDPLTDPDSALAELAGPRRAASAYPASGVGDDEDLANTLPPHDIETYDGDPTMSIVPLRSDDFVCSACFLIQHQHRLAPGGAANTVCLDCS